MKAKTNLELFYNEIEWTIKHSDKTAYYALYRTLFDIYYRETGAEKTSSIFDMLKWYADVPRETLELYDYYYNFIKEYFKEMSDTIRKCDEPLDQYVVLDVLLKLNVIPSKYAKMPFNEFVSIIRLKENNK